MTEKTNKIKLPKYSSYLTDTDSELLDLFCSQFDCRKAKALPLLLKFWNDNKDNVSNELAIISYEDISVKKYEDRLATIEDKLANISYDTELATIKERLATLENMLATIADSELASISNELAVDNDLIGVEKNEDNLLGAILANIQKEEITEDSTLSECPNLALNEVSPQIVPTEENKPLNEEKTEKEKKISNAEKFLGYLGTITNEEKIENKQWLEEKLGIGKGFFSQKKGKELWGEYLEFNTTEKFFFKKQSI